MIQYFPLSGRFVFTDDTATPPHVVFDSDDELLSVAPGDVRIGSQVVPARTAYSSGVNGDQIVVDVETSYFLADVALPGAHVARGMMRSTWDSNPEPADNLWRQASGTHVDILDGVSTTQVPQSDTGGYNRVASLGGYTLHINELGHLVLHERIVMRARDAGGPPASYNRARQQATVSFRLLIGFFAGADFTEYVGARFTGSRSSPSTFASYTFNHDFGYGFSGRRLLVFVAASYVPTSVQIGGSAATLVGSKVQGATVLSAWSLMRDAGEVLSVTLSFPGGSNYGFQSFQVANSVNAAVVSDGGASVSLLDVDTNTGATGVAVVASAITGAPFCNTGWSGAIEKADIDFYGGINYLGVPFSSGKFLSSAVVPAGSGASTVTATYSVSGTAALLAVVLT